MYLKFAISIHLLSLILASSLLGQHNPIVTYYSSSDYGGHHQNWSITESTDRDIFAANTYGLIFGNGNAWKLCPLPGKKIIRSVCAAGNKIYTGSHGDIGYWEADSCGTYHYSSLKNQLPAGLIDNEEIWDIQAEGETIWMQSFSVLLSYKNGRFQHVKMPGSIMFLQIFEKKKLIPVLEKGIFEIGPAGDVIPWSGGSFFKDKVVTGIVETKPQTYLIATSDHGIFLHQHGRIQPWLPDWDQIISKIQINRLILTKNEKVVLGTINGGVYIFTKDGKLLHHIHSGNGLRNNTVLSIAEDKSGDVWVGLDKGLAKIHLSKREMAYEDTYGTIGSVYTALQHEGIWYLGTNQGMYKYDASNETFKMVPGTQGQCWQIFAIGSELYCGHNDGLFIIESGKARLISHVTGGWYQEALVASNRKLWLQGNYTGLALFEQNGHKLKFVQQLEGFSLPVKKFIIHPSGCWATSPNNGLYQLTLSPEKTEVSRADRVSENFGLPNADNVDIFIFDDTLRAYNGQQHYYFNTEKNQFLFDPFFNSFKSTFIARPLMGRQWLMILPDCCVRMNNKQRAGVLPVILNRDYFAVRKATLDQYILCTDNGYHIIPAEPEKIPEKVVVDIKITLEGHQCITDANSQIPGNKSSFVIEFYDHDFSAGKSYQYRILPVQKEWKPTHTSSSVAINHLEPGNYTLEISRHDGNISVKNFTILPPWYQTWPARFFYFLLGMALFFFIKEYYDKRLEKARLQYQHEQDRLIKAHEMEMENQRLSHENQVKNKELANSALQLVHKNETLQEIKKELIEIRKSSHHMLTTQDFQLLMKQINENLTVQEDQKLFDDSFDLVNKHFFSTLMKLYPGISKEDLKLAAYIKMDLTSKEIAPLLNLSLRGLENKRYRLRKKLGIQGEENLTAFFRNIVNSA